MVLMITVTVIDGGFFLTFSLPMHLQNGNNTGVFLSGVIVKD